jgi:hypothetical protein
MPHSISSHLGCTYTHLDLSYCTNQFNQQILGDPITSIQRRIKSSSAIVLFSVSYLFFQIISQHTHLATRLNLRKLLHLYGYLHTRLQLELSEA